MNKATIESLSVLALSPSACGKKDEPVGEPSTSAEVSADASMPAVAASPSQAFANAAAASDAFEIQASQLAAEKGASAKTKKFAEQMIKAHTESTAKLKTAAAAASITPDPMLTAQQQQMLDGLKSKSGAEFDTAFAKAQVDGHQATLDALKAYSATGDTPALKAFATELVPTVTAHLNMAKSL